MQKEFRIRATAGVACSGTRGTWRQELLTYASLGGGGAQRLCKPPRRLMRCHLRGVSRLPRRNSAAMHAMRPGHGNKPPRRGGHASPGQGHAQRRHCLL